MRLLLNLIAVLFLILYFTTTLFNRYTSDDMLILSLLDNSNFMQLTETLYSTWCGRWFSLSIYIALLDLFGNYQYFLALFNIAIMTLLILTIFLNLKNISTFKDYTNTSLISIAIIFVLLFFYSTFNISESWFWYSVTGGAYFLNIISFLLAISFLFKNKQNKYLEYPIITITGLYIGSASEPTAILFIIILIVALRISNKKALSTYFVIIITIAFTLNIMSIGTNNRYNALTASNSNIDIYKYIYLTYLFLIKFLKIIPLSLIFSIPFLILGTYHNKNIKTPTTKHIILAVSIFFIISILFNTMILFVMKDIGPDRVYIILNLAFAILIATIAFIIGHKIKTYIISKPYITIISLSSIAGILIYINITHFYIHKNYSTEYDKRINILKTNNSKYLILKKLPPSGYIHNEEIKTDTFHFNNQCLKKYLKLKYTPKLKTNKPNAIK